MRHLSVFAEFLSVAMLAAGLAGAQNQQPGRESLRYLKLTEPRRVLTEAQAWEGDQFPHTLSVLELKRGGFRYWGWYGLNEGRGIGLARSNDLLHWIKYEKNPLWINARWPTALAKVDPKHPEVLYFAVTRDYDTPSSYIVLATSADGIHLTEKETLVTAVPNQRHQNPNLFRDPRSKRFYLTYYRGNDHDQFEIVSRNARSITDLDKAPERVLWKSNTTVAAPTLLYVKGAKRANGKKGVYFLATEIYPHRYTTDPEGEWQVQVFAGDAPDGDFYPVSGSPTMTGQRACLFQHIFKGRFYGYDCQLDAGKDEWRMEEVEAPLP